MLAINYFAIPLRFGRRTRTLFITEILVSPLHFPLQIITDALTLLSYFKNINIVTRIQPSFAAHGFKGTMCLYLLSYYPGNKPCPRPVVNTPKPQPQQTYNQNTQSGKDNRKSGFWNPKVFENKLEEALGIIGPYNNLHLLDGIHGSIQNLNLNLRLVHNTYTSSIEINGTLEYSMLGTVTNDYIIQSTQSQIINHIIPTVKRNITNVVENVLAEYRDQYTGHDMKHKLTIKIDYKITNI